MIVTDVGCGMRWTRQRFACGVMAGRVLKEPVSDHKHADERCSSRTAKSCGPDAPTLASSFAEACRPYRARTFHIRGRRWQKSPVTGESTTYAVKTIAQGMPGVPAHLW
jgi:hypothetical protein